MKDLFYLDVMNRTWFFVKSVGELPGKVYDHTAVLDAAGRMWLAGGFADGRPNSNVSYLDTLNCLIRKCLSVRYIKVPVGNISILLRI